MDSFHLPLHLSIYTSPLLAYVSITIDKILSDNHPDGTQRQRSSFQRPQDHQEDCRLLCNCKTKRKVNCFLRDCDVT
ncbi:hypothetical protein Bca52824_028216 [Brassica carinata]|uniref:Uncharacterized protein n=1 Tax=Brassica carinata TaxID=52824 RepID=A0A8X8APL8_BRACI|nr:hypothetical protein Bca52824_028216 [Brassica carinata]